MAHLLKKVRARARSLGRLWAHFARGRTLFLLPLLIILLAAALVLIGTGGLSYVAPFLYAIF